MYVASTDALATPTVTSGSIVGSDVGVFSEAYQNRHVGTAKMLVPSGSVTVPYTTLYRSITFVNSANGEITARPITVTAAANTKVYDATTDALATPAVPSHANVGCGVGVFSEAYQNRHVGTGKTLVPSGSVTDGNSGNDYA